uniref:Uncharacterized protein n=1 Tax=Sphaerodactylus townsendi TaxID=933632 RepID=A0ACB8GAM7_9SAUR
MTLRKRRRSNLSSNTSNQKPPKQSKIDDFTTNYSQQSHRNELKLSNRFEVLETSVSETFAAPADSFSHEESLLMNEVANNSLHEEESAYPSPLLPLVTTKCLPAAGSSSVFNHHEPLSYSSEVRIRISLSKLLNCQPKKTHLKSFQRLPYRNKYTRLVLSFESPDTPSYLLKHKAFFAKSYDIWVNRVFYNTKINKLVDISSNKKSFNKVISLKEPSTFASCTLPETLNRNTERMNEINSILTEWNCLKALIEGMASHQRSHKNSDVIPPTKQVAEIIRQPQIDPAPHSQLLDLSIHQQPIQYQTINRENLKTPLKPLNQEIDIDLRSERVLNYRDFRSLGGKSWAAELEELQLCSIDPSPGTTSDTITHNGTDETLICISSKVPPIEHESTINEGKNTEGFCDLSIGLQEDPVDISASSAPALGQRNFIKSTAQVHHYDIIPNNGSTSQNTGTISRVPISVTHPDMNSIVNRISSNGCVQYPQSQITPLDGTA